MIHNKSFYIISILLISLLRIDIHIFQQNILPL